MHANSRHTLRSAAAYAMLFALSMGATTAWMQWQHRSAEAETGLIADASVNAGAPAPRTPARATPAPTPTRRANAALETTALDAHALDEASTVDASQREAEPDPAQRALASGDPDAILQVLLGMTTASPESVQTLAQISTGHADVGTRLAAISTLRRVVTNQGDSDGRIRKMLYAVKGPDTQTIELATETAAQLDATLAGR